VCLMSVSSLYLLVNGQLAMTTEHRETTELSLFVFIISLVLMYILLSGIYADVFKI